MPILKNWTPQMKASLITGASGALSQGINAYVQSNVNQQQQVYNLDMYKMQRQDALADWQRNNEYNHPSAQMARLREAGLNPNLVYGGGATTEAAMVRNTDTKQWSPHAPQVDLGSIAGNSLMAYYNVQESQARIDNLRTQNTVMVQDAALRAAQVANTLQSTAASVVKTGLDKFDLDMKNDLRENTIEFAKQGLQKLMADKQFTLDSNERAAAMNSATIQEAYARIQRMRIENAVSEEQRKKIIQETKNLEQEGLLKKIDLYFAQHGVYKSDPAWMRVLGEILGKQSNILKTDPTIPVIKHTTGLPPGINPFADFFK